MANFLSGEKEAFDRFHTSKDAKGCLNSKQGKSICFNCEQICPKGIMNHDASKHTSFEACIDCNLCAVVCPIRTISFSSVNAKKFQEILKSKFETITIGCYKNGFDKNLDLYCIASLPWEILAHLAINKKLIFYYDKCNSCLENSLLEIFEKNIKRVKEFLGKELYNKNINLSLDEVKTDISSRKGLFSSIKRSVLNYKDNYIHKISRKDMYKRLKFYAKDKIFGWKTLNINDKKCCGCQICENICPFDAISITKSNNTITLYHSAMRCNECGLCKTTCLFGAIEGFKPIHLKGSLIHYHENKIRPNKCSCGEFIPHNRQECFLCENKSKTINLFA